MRVSGCVVAALRWTNELGSRCRARSGVARRETDEAPQTVCAWRWCEKNRADVSGLGVVPMALLACAEPCRYELLLIRRLPPAVRSHDTMRTTGRMQSPAAGMRTVVGGSACQAHSLASRRMHSPSMALRRQVTCDHGDTALAVGYLRP
jgi:hypothetical protein